MLFSFNRPGTTSQRDETLLQLFVRCLRAAKRCSTVWGSVMAWNDLELASGTDSSGTLHGTVETIAEQRDLSCHFAIGFDDSDDPPDEQWEPGPGVKSMIRSMRKSVIKSRDPDGILNHNKFFLFEDIDHALLHESASNTSCGPTPQGSGPGLFLTSSNFTESSKGKHNVAVLVPISAATRDMIAEYYDDLRKEYRANVFDNTVEDRYETSVSKLCKVYLFPRRQAWPAADTLLSVIKNIAHYHQSGRTDSCRIRIVTPGWYDSRVELAEAVAQIKRMHPSAVVKVISREPDDDDSGIRMRKGIRRTLEDAGVELYFQSEDVNIHSKYLLVDAPYKSGDTYERQQLVWMGSPNLSKSAVTGHWEMLAKLYEESGAYEQFGNDFDLLLKEEAARPA